MEILKIIILNPAALLCKNSAWGSLTFSLYCVYCVYMGEFNWNFVLSQVDERAMYRQIIDQVQQHVALGDLPEGTPLPSMRELASILKVSMITVKRAYLELARAGTIIIQHGKGSWVAGGLNIQIMRRRELGMHLKRAGELAEMIGISPAELTALVEEYITI